MGTTKGYTINYFLELFGNSRSRQLTNLYAVQSFVSPRLGADSVRYNVLNNWLGRNTTSIINGTGRFASYGATPRARLITALRNRKANGFV